MSTLFASPPRPLPIVLEPPTPKKPARSAIKKTPAMFQTHQATRKLILDRPECDVEETDIDDLLADERVKCVLDIVENSKGETILLYDDGTYCLAKQMQQQ